MSDTQSKTNNALIFFVVTVGIIMLANLFELLTWEVWKQGGIIAGIILAFNLLQKKKWAYKISQIAMIILTFALSTHSILAITNPSYLKTQQSSLTDYELFHQTMELKSTQYSEIVKKEININMDYLEYNIVDSKDKSYIFKMHPTGKPDSLASISYNNKGAILEVFFKSREYSMSSTQNLLNIKPTLILGTPAIPASIDLNVTGNTKLNLDLQNQKVDDFTAFLAGGQSSIRFSKSSMPKSKTTITVRGGHLDLILPKEMENEIKYIVKDEFKFLIGEQRFTGYGTYKILSEGEKGEGEITLHLDSGTLDIFVD